MLLKLIWQGQISDSVDAALDSALKDQEDPYIKTCAIRAIAAAGTPTQQHHLVNSLLADVSKLDQRTLGEICESFFPDHLSVQQLIEILKTVAQPKAYSSPVQYSLENIALALAPDKTDEQLLRQFHQLLKSPPFIERYHCEISVRYAWLLPHAIRLANLFIEKKLPFSFDPMVLDLFLIFIPMQDYHELYISRQEELLKCAEAWPEFRYQLFRHTVAAVRARGTGDEKSPTAWWEVCADLRDFWAPNSGDLERLFENLVRQSLMDDRLIALTAMFQIYLKEERPRKLRERMKRLVVGTLELETQLHELLHPQPFPREMKKWRRQDRDLKRRHEEREKLHKALGLKNQRTIKERRKEIKNVGDAKKGEIWQRTTYLYERMQEKREKGNSRFGNPNWQFLIDEFGIDVAENFRDGCIDYWRAYDPFCYSNRRTSNSIPWPRIIGLSGLAMEATSDPEWVSNLTPAEVTTAAHYAICEMSGFPFWFKALRNQFPHLVDPVIEDELRWELHGSKAKEIHPHTLTALQYGDEELPHCYRDALFNLLSEKEPEPDRELDYALALMLKGHLSIPFRRQVSELACKCFETALDQNRKFTWLGVLLCFDGTRGSKVLKKWILDLPDRAGQKETMINFCASLTDHGETPRFNPTFRDYEKVAVSNDLLPFIYEFIGVDKDPQHEGVFTAGTRDHAADTRSRLLGVIVNTPGRSSYDALMNLS